jgi:hypothetical protein
MRLVQEALLSDTPTAVGRPRARAGGGNQFTTTSRNKPRAAPTLLWPAIFPFYYRAFSRSRPLRAFPTFSVCYGACRAAQRLEAGVQMVVASECWS